MKKQLLAAVAAFICIFAAIPVAPAQTALFTYNNGTAPPNSGTYTPGSSFTFAIDLTFAPGGTVTNLEGLSYWLQQKTPSGAPFYFSITDRDVVGPAVGGVAGPSPFTDLQTPGLTYPQNLNPSNANDLGGALPASGPGSTPLTAGTYFVANITIAISPTAPDTGTFVLDETLTGGKTSVISDSSGHTAPITEADYTITLVPEPSTWAGAVLALVALFFTQRRQMARLGRTVFSATSLN